MATITVIWHRADKRLCSFHIWDNVNNCINTAAFPQRTNSSEPMLAKEH